MAEHFGANITLSEGTPLSPLVSPSVEEMMIERVRELCAEVEECHETIHELKKRNRELENMLYEMRLELARSKQQEMSAQTSVGSTNYYFNIDTVEQLNANVKKGAEVVHTKMS